MFFGRAKARFIGMFEEHKSGERLLLFQYEY